MASDKSVDALLAEYERQKEQGRKDPRIGELVVAARKGEVETVKRLLAAGGDPNAPAPSPEATSDMLETPLWAALYGRKPAVVKLLADAGADVNEGFPDTPLGAAINLKNLDLIRALIAGGADVNLANRSHETPLLKAVQSENAEIVQELVNAGADPNRVAKKKNWDTVTNYSPLEFATMMRNKKLITILAASGAGGKKLPGMLLCAAAGSGDLAEVKRKIEQEGVDIHCRDPQGQTPLICAALEGRATVVKYLIDHGADVNLAAGAKSDGESPLIAAAMSGKVPVVKLLVEAGANLDYEPQGQKGHTALAYAKAERLKKVVEYLLEVQKAQGKSQRSIIPVGVPTFDTNDAAFVVEATVEQTAGAFAKLRDARTWTRNVLGGKVKLAARSFAIFKLTGQPWSIVMKLNCPTYKTWPSLADAKAMSASLRTRALFVANSDTGGVTQYALFEKGKLVEFFDYGSSNRETPANEIARKLSSMYKIDLDSLPNFSHHEGKVFGSLLRDVKLARVKNDLDFVNDYLKEQNAFIPFGLEEWGEAGETVELSLEGLGPDDVERLDYVATR